MSSHGAEHPLLSLHGALRREGIGFVEDEMTRRAVEVVEGLGKVGHEVDALMLAKERQVDNERQVLLDHQAGNRLAGARRDGNVRVVPAGNDDGKAGALAVR